MKDRQRNMNDKQCKHEVPVKAVIGSHPNAAATPVVAVQITHHELLCPLFVDKAPGSDCHNDNDSNDDEKHNETTAHPFPGGLLITLGLHQFIDPRLDMIPGFANLPAQDKTVLVCMTQVKANISQSYQSSKHVMSLHLIQAGMSYELHSSL